MANEINIREVSGCTCLRARRTTRQLTQIYDRELEPAGVTINQFGLLAKLHGATLGGAKSVSVGALADLLGTHPTTLNRHLKPLKAQELVTDAVDPVDRRVRAVMITGKGRAKLRQAVPLWRCAQRRVEKVLGVDAMLALNDLLDFTSAKLTE